jgi:hypothetical protein
VQEADQQPGEPGSENESGSDFASSLAVVEDFFGERLEADHIKRVRNMPIEQMVELAHRMNNYRNRLEKGVLVNIGTRVGVSDTILFEGADVVPVSQMPQVKQAALLVESAIVPDPSLDWAFKLSLDDSIGRADTQEEELSAQRQLIEALLELHAMADLIRVGALLPVPTARRFAVGRSPWPPAVADYPDQESLTQDPVLRRLLVEAGLSDVQLKATFTGPELLATVEQETTLPGAKGLMAILRHALGPEDLHAALRGATFQAVCAATGGTPMATLPSVSRHVGASSALLLDPELSASDAWAAGEQGASHSYRLVFPRLEGVSFAEISLLRENEELFAVVRESLAELSAHVADIPQSGSLMAFTSEVRAAAEDIVGPIQAKLQREFDRANAKSLLTRFAVQGLVSVGVSGCQWGCSPGLSAGSHSGSGSRVQRRSSCG